MSRLRGKDGLTDKQRAFVHWMAHPDVDGNATEAAVRAGYGGSRERAKESAREVAAHRVVKRALEKARKRVAERIAKSAADYAERIDEIAFKEPDQAWQASTIVSMVTLGARIRGMVKDEATPSGPVSIVVVDPYARRPMTNGNDDHTTVHALPSPEGSS